MGSMTQAMVIATATLLGACVLHTRPAPSVRWAATGTAQVYVIGETQAGPVEAGPVEAGSVEAYPSPGACTWEAAFEARYHQPFRVEDVAFLLYGGGEVRGIDRLVPWMYNSFTTHPSVDTADLAGNHVVGFELRSARDGSVLATRGNSYLEGLGHALDLAPTNRADVATVLLRQLALPDNATMSSSDVLRAVAAPAEAGISADRLDSFRRAMARFLRETDLAAGAIPPRPSQFGGQASIPDGEVRWDIEIDLTAGFDPRFGVLALPRINGDYGPTPPRSAFPWITIPLHPPCAP